MDKKQKQTFRVLITIGTLGTLAALFNIFWNSDTDWYIDILSLVASMSLIYGAQQLKQGNEQNNLES